MYGKLGADPYELAAAHVGVTRRTWERRSRAARGLCWMLRDAFGGPEERPTPGMLALWKRAGAAWQYHVSPVITVTRDRFSTMQFNRGAIVHIQCGHRVGERNLYGFFRVDA